MFSRPKYAALIVTGPGTARQYLLKSERCISCDWNQNEWAILHYISREFCRQPIIVHFHPNKFYASISLAAKPRTPEVYKQYRIMFQKSRNWEVHVNTLINLRAP